ncbi:MULTISPECIES: PAS domain S-box protein [unclassified Arcicella]|uniref:PAS domain S-box protein n=1 Tax=unclassified Arcicella TaxID=2644986 RepID=UPI0028642940|nr:MULTISPECIES: PAS domain S-box protein [unclassified Arcicella]MDR6563133.1 PAS domain S-box-containing protein [Arcicella sp. BE51]MDR6811716.1 PAS domain S-box-containing protein [Arcicella sp. BE140]MDR6823241.1 PAS domain S-box-containing protein [Arcicella sp. BE139]
MESLEFTIMLSMNEFEKPFNIIDALSTILDNVPDSIILLSPQHKILAFNKGMKELLMLYFKSEVKVGDDYRIFVLDSIMDLYVDTFEKAINGETVVVQKETVSQDASIWFEYTMKPVYDVANSFLGIVLIAKNIDKQKRIELELENMAETFQAIIENNTESVLLLGLDYKIIQFNKPARERMLMNMDKELKIGEDFRDFLYPDQEQIFFNSFESAIKGKSYEIEVVITNYNNEKYWFQSRMFPVYKRNGELLGVSLFALNITDRKKAEVSLKDSEAKFRSIVEAAPTSMLIVDENMNIILSNPEVEKVFGYTFDELKKQNIQMLIPEIFGKDDTQKDYSKIVANKFTPAIKKDGSEIIVDTSLNSFELDDKKHVLIIIQDVTQRVNNEKQILDQLSRLKAIAWQQSHGVRRPVANILGICHLLKTDKDITPEEKEQYIDLLFQSTEELDQVIHRIVNYTCESNLFKQE